MATRLFREIVLDAEVLINSIVSLHCRQESLRFEEGELVAVNGRLAQLHDSRAELLNQANGAPNHAVIRLFSRRIEIELRILDAEELRGQIQNRVAEIQEEIAGTRQRITEVQNGTITRMRNYNFPTRIVLTSMGHIHTAGLLEHWLRCRQLPRNRRLQRNRRWTLGQNFRIAFRQVIADQRRIYQLDLRNPDGSQFQAAQGA